MENALLYFRVSTKGQEANGYSLDAQEKLVYDYAKENNLRIVKVWKVAESAWVKKSEKFLIKWLSMQKTS